ncbi:hypothetical protein BV22DRAFT_1135311 [Leucogyrophana mollusca]|uniref:Uncharacterized protein n=1 Tax=Leucogyrophana mollusca TaxID=85980 RepID=A0ACB8AWZ0_9AGAM|nr:hypothetical protein BV22DRAFT_1135311 [Leucogyrophana mollusca]
MSRPVTRAKNANQHPGDIINNLKRKYRSPEEVANERQLEQEVQDEREGNRRRGLQRIASLEDSLTKEHMASVSEAVAAPASGKRKEGSRKKEDAKVKLTGNGDSLGPQQPKKKGKGASGFQNAPKSTTRDTIASVRNEMEVDAKEEEAHRDRSVLNDAEKGNTQSHSTFCDEDSKPSGLVASWSEKVANASHSRTPSSSTRTSTLSTRTSTLSQASTHSTTVKHSTGTTRRSWAKQAPLPIPLQVSDANEDENSVPLQCRPLMEQAGKELQSLLEIRSSVTPPPSTQVPGPAQRMIEERDDVSDEEIRAQDVDEWDEVIEIDSSAPPSPTMPNTKPRARAVRKPSIFDAEDFDVGEIKVEDEKPVRNFDGPSVRGAKRQTTSTAVEIFTNEPPQKRARVQVKATSNGSKKGKARVASEKFKNDDLPQGAHQGNRFRRYFISTVLYWAGDVSDPWNFVEATQIEAMQASWDAIFEDPLTGALVPHIILPRKAVSYVTCQRIYEWRSGFGSTALTVVNSFFASDKHFEGNAARQQYARSTLKDLAFLYANADLKGDPCNVFVILVHSIH